MSFSNALETALLNHYFTNAAIANVGDAGGLQPSAVAGSLYVSLHVADPGEGGSQNTSPATYTGYAYAAIARSGAGFTVSGNNVQNAALVSFPACTGGSDTITHWGLGRSSSGAGTLDFSGCLGASVQGPFTAATNDNITIPGHTLIVDDRVAFFPAYGSTLPTGITEGTLYWVKTSATDVITISATQGGATLDITASGDGVAYKAATLAVSNGITPQIAAGAMSITLD